MKIKDLTLAILSSLALAAAAQSQGDAPPDPIDVPQYCQGCIADAKTDLPTTFQYFTGIDGCFEGSIDWTVDRALERDGRCVDLAGSCIAERQCVAIAVGVGTATTIGGSFTLHLQAEASACGGQDEDMANVADPLCGSTFGANPTVSASCGLCVRE